MLRPVGVSANLGVGIMYWCVVFASRSIWERNGRSKEEVKSGN